jgi:hypothetical protein
VHSSNCNALTGADMLHRYTGSFVARMICIVWRLFPLVRRIWFTSYSILPYFGLIRTFVGSDAVGFDLAWVYGRYAVACIVNGLVLRFVV